MAGEEIRQPFSLALIRIARITETWKVHICVVEMDEVSKVRGKFPPLPRLCPKLRCQDFSVEFVALYY